jgi:predicted Zn-dependent peptidase
MIYQEYQRTTLPNGIIVISEHISSVRSISLGVWVRTGTRYENPANNGVAHFLEHMMFKGTKKRSPRQIARHIESLGGQINAFTSKEQTCYHVEILDEHLPKALDVLADILCHSQFSKKEIEKERGVILDEIDSVEDAPDEMIHEIFVEKLYPNHGLGYPILGTRETVSAMQPGEIVHFYQSQYVTGNIVIAAAGNIDHDQLLKLAEKKFHFPAGDIPGQPQAPQQFSAGEFCLEKPINQAHICMGVPAYAFNHPRRYDVMVINAILGGGMASRLFQNIRERYGIAYGIYSFFDFYFDSGLFGIYLGTDKNNTFRVIKLIEKELKRLRESAVTRRELQEAKSQLKGNLVLGLESTAARMNRLAMMEMYLDHFKTIDAVIEKIEEVTPDSVLQTAQELFRPDQFLTVIYAPMD